MTPCRGRAEIGTTWRRLAASRGQAMIGTLAADVGWSRRQLGAVFRTEFGLTPKEAARVLRFEHAHELATTSPQASWTTISAAAGYADQSHLIREWSQFTGLAPTAWRRNEVLPT